MEVNILEGKKYKKSNDLINSRGRSSLLVQRLFAISIQQAELDEKGMLRASIYGTDLKKIFGTTSNNLYKTIKEAIQPKRNKASIMDYRIIITNDQEKSLEAINVIMDASFEDGVFNIRFNDKITKELWELKANYTTFALEETMRFRSVYTWRIYEMLKAVWDKYSHLDKRKGLPPKEPYIIVMNLTDLKLRLGIIDAQSSNDIVAALKKDTPDFERIEDLAERDEEAQKLKEYGDLRKNVLEKARKEMLDKSTNIYYTYEPIRSGKGGKTKAIRFFIYNKNKKNTVIESQSTLTQEEKDNIVDEISVLIEEKIKPKECRQIAEAAEYDLSKVQKAYAVAKSTKNIDNIVGFMIKAIQDDYEIPVSRIGTSKWGNFEQQKLDFRTLEEQLLDN